jgi:hypothetical protein
MISFDYSAEAQNLQAERLREAIDAALSDTEDRLCLLIDPVSLPENVEHPFTSALVAQRPVPVRLPHETLSADSYPWLVALDVHHPPHAALLAQSIAFAQQELHPERLSQGCGRAVCGWLTSPYDTEVIARQLGETAIQRLPDNASVLLRYYDPPVHSVLWSYFSELQQRRWLGVIRNWLYIDGDGQPVIHRHTPAAHPHYTFSLALCEDDATTLAVTGKINRTLEQYRLHGQNAARHQEAQAVRLIRAALARAESLYGFDHEHDQQALALDCLRWHPRFDMHPDMQVLLSPQERDAQASYTRCVLSLTDTLRQKMCDELSTTTTTTAPA